MKKRINTSQLGSMMIEALAMLALIALVTPILYRKTAERTTELQDINTAGELRSIIKAVDDYVAANYDAISQGGSVTNSCGTQSYANFGTAGHSTVNVPIGHFCEFLPYGILNADGSAKGSRLFSDNYQIVLKSKGSNNDKVITAFVVTDPNTDMKEMRSSSIASMIGGNGGYVTEASTSGGSGGKISGNLGIWSIDNAKTELGVDVKKGAVVAASIQGISSQTAKIDLEGVLYRKERRDDPDLNTMSTTLYMGAKGSNGAGNDIVNIKNLIVGAETNNAKGLYIAPDKLRIKDDQVVLNANGTVSMKSDLTTGGKATVTGELHAMNDTFKVLSNALQYGSYLYAGAVNNGSVLSIGNTVQATAPLAVTSGADCGANNPTNCALYVAGSGYFGNNLTVSNTFSANNLHARSRLTVGGDNATDSKALDVTYTNDNSSLMNFGANLFKVTKTGNGLGKLEFAPDFITFEKTGSATTAKIKGFTDLDFISANTNGRLHITNDVARIQAAANSYLDMISGDALMYATTTNIAGQTVSLNANALKITSATSISGGIVSSSSNNITSSADSFKITPTGTTNNFEVKNEGTKGKVNIAGLNTYITGTSASDKNNVTMKNSDFYLKNNANDDIIRLSDTSGSAQIDVSGQKVLMKDNGKNAVLKIDLTTNSEANEGYPIYIRKGAIELTQANTAGNLANNYVKADRFVASSTANPTLYQYSATGTYSGSTTYPYQVNPAYTSVMHDIKLTTRGGARLSDILPDFINKGIYVVDNTYPAYHSSCTGGGNGIKLAEYIAMSVNDKNAKGSCNSLYDQVSPWAGFVPTPTCPPGYSKVITLTPASFAVAQAGIPKAGIKNQSGLDLLNEDLLIPTEVKSPYDYLGDDAGSDVEPTPLYFQKNTWLKSFVSAYGSGTTFKGWDVGMGFIYPYYHYEDYIKKVGPNDYNSLDYSGASKDQIVIWNLFPVYAGTLEGYATVYCYFNRSNFSAPYVDTTYDQLNRFRDYYSKSDGTYNNRLNSSDATSSVGVW